MTRATEAGIEGTARHAANLGYIPMVVEDAVGSADKVKHENSLNYMRGSFEVKTTKDVLELIQTGVT